MMKIHHTQFIQGRFSVEQRFISFPSALLVGGKAIALSLLYLCAPMTPASSAQSLPVHRFQPSILMAQAIPDATLPSPSIVTSSNGAPNNLEQFVTGGTVSGNSLFHSFQEFSILDGQTIQFQNNVTLDHIITRVTGTAISTLSGTLETQGTADFFLLNPNGIVFGPNAVLDIGGSFIGSTADRLLFENNTEFSAVAPQAPPLLTITTPIGLQFDSDPGLIQVEGNGHQLSLNLDTLEIIQTNRPEGLQVNEGETFALVGGPITLDGGNVTARNGRVALSAVGSGETVALVGDTLGWTLAHSNFTDRTNGNAQDISLSNAASVLTSGSSGGQIQLVGNAIALTDGSTLLASTLGTGDGQGIDVNATERIILTGSMLDAVTGELIFPSSILTEVALGVSGDGGDIDLRAERLRVVDGAQVSTSTFGAGNAGDVTVEANRVLLRGGAANEPSGLFASVLDEESTGQGGGLKVVADRLTISEGAELQVTTFGFGDGGTIDLDVNNLVVVGKNGADGGSGIFAETEGPGQGGTIQVDGDRLSILNSGTISSTAFGTGDGGIVEITMGQIVLDGIAFFRGDAIGSSISATVDSVDGALGEGQGGAVVIRADQLQVKNGAHINVSTFGPGDGGRLTVEADRIHLQGGNDQPTGLFATTQPNADGEVWAGNGGELQIVSDRLVVENGAQVVSGTFSDGNAGSLAVTTRELLVRGQTQQARSGLFANAVFRAGNGGDVRVNADTVRVTDGGTLNASNFFSRNLEVPAGTGMAGSVVVQADDIVLEREGLISASTNVGDEGNIQIGGDRLLLTNQSQIITDANSADGGNINIEADVVVAIANSDITANANRGRGGRVIVTAQSLLGTEFRDRLTSLSDITATSNLGAEFDGIVQINAPESDVQPDAGSLPDHTVDVDRLIAQSCIRPRDRGRFLITGRGGLPPVTIAPSTFGFDTYSFPLQTLRGNGPHPNAILTMAPSSIPWLFSDGSSSGSDNMPSLDFTEQTPIQLTQRCSHSSSN